MKIKIFMVLLACLFIFACFEETTARQEEVKKAEETVDWVAIEKTVNSLTELGLIQKIDTGAGKAWVDIFKWQMANAEQKETFTKTMAFYCAHKRGDSTYFVDIFDWLSGKSIAKYDAWGFKVF